jgi:hypothetical protein
VRCLAVMAMCLCCLHNALAAEDDSLLFDNITANGGLMNNYGRASQSAVAYPLDAGAADDFVLPNGGAIARVHWLGSYYNGSPAAIDSWNIVFWPDAGGVPAGGAAAGHGPDYSRAVARYCVTGNGNEKAASGTIYSYSVDLPQRFLAAPGERYWLEVQPVLHCPPQWMWSMTNRAQGDQAVCGFDYFDNLPYWTVSYPGRDQAFTLIGTVPEPGTLALLAAAVLLLPLYRWRRISGRTDLTGSASGDANGLPPRRQRTVRSSHRA